MTLSAVSRSGKDLLTRIANAVAPERGRGVPTDVVSLARRLGAYDVVYRARSAHGFTEWTPKGPRVVLNWAESEGRRRTVLAHECGHLLFDPIFKPDVLAAMSDTAGQSITTAASALGTTPNDVRKLLADTPLEAVCDSFAYELVLPDAVASQAASRVQTIDDIGQFCDDWRISMTVAVLALNRHRGSRSAPRLGILQTRRTAGDYWMAGSTCGLPTQWRGRVVLTPESGRVIDAMRRDDRRVAHVQLSNGEGQREVVAQIAKYRERATVMVRADDLL